MRIKLCKEVYLYNLCKLYCFLVALKLGELRHERHPDHMTDTRIILHLLFVILLKAFNVMTATRRV